MRALVLVITAALAAPRDPFTSQREALADSLGQRGIRDKRVLDAIRSVPRHAFVPQTQHPWAYSDTPLPIGLGQTISQPFVVAVMTELLDVRGHHRVLEIGTGSGYQAAILSGLVKEVFTIELEPELARSGAERLRLLGYSNVIVKQGDGYRGWPEQSPFDRVIVTAAPPEVPQSLIDQLKPGGRLVAPVGRGEQWLQVIDKGHDGKIKRQSVLPVRFVPMRRGKGQ